jgi:hypothetical protein
VAETLQTLLEKFQSHLNDTQRLTLAGVAILEKMRVGRQTQLDMDHLLGEAAVLDGATLQELGAVEWNADLGQYELIADATTRGQFQQWLRRKQSGLAAEAARDLFLRRGARDCEHLQPAGCLVAPIWIVGLADRQGTLADPNTRSHFLHQAILESSTLRFLAEDSVQRWRELLNRWDAEESYQGKVVLADEAKRMIRVDPLPETLEGLYRYLCDQAGEASAKLREARQRLDDLERGIEKAERHEDVERLLKLTSRLAEQRRELENTARWPERYQRDAETLWSAIHAFVTPARHRLDFAVKLPESRASSRFPPSDGNRTEKSEAA